MLRRSRARFPFVQRAFVDGGYAGRLVRWAERQTHIVLEVIKGGATQVGFAVIRRWWVLFDREEKVKSYLRRAPPPDQGCFRSRPC